MDESPSHAEFRGQVSASLQHLRDAHARLETMLEAARVAADRSEELCRQRIEAVTHLADERFATADQLEATTKWVEERYGPVRTLFYRILIAVAIGVLAWAGTILTNAQRALPLLPPHP